MCLYPTYRTVQDKDTKLHKLVKTTCGKCPECLEKKRQEWLVRLKLEMENSLNCFFVTLTYNDEHLPKQDGKPCFSKRDIQLFLKRLRSSVKQKYKISDGIKYFIVSEYGGQFGRPHYHGIFYNLPPHLNLLQQNELIQDNWQNGFVSVFATTPKCLGYVCKYCLQNIQSRNAYSHEDFAPFLLTSKRPALGSSYLTTSNIAFHLLNRTFETTLHGSKIVLPRYLRNKIFDDYKDIKDSITTDFLNKEYEDYCKRIQVPENYRKISALNYQNGKHKVQRFLKYRKDKFGFTEESAKDRFNYYLKN